MSLENLTAFMALKKHRGTLELLEIFGGKAGVTRIAIRRRLRTGSNFDVVVGCDLTVDSNVRLLLQYIDQHKPTVVVGGPPCTAFGSWSRYNRVHAPESYAERRRVGVKLAEVFCRVARLQAQAGRFWLCENPAGSELFKLPCFEELWSRGRGLCSINFPQCAVGLKSPEGHPLLKWTTLWANHPALLQPFEGLSCNCDFHGEIAGNYKGTLRSKLAQVWPYDMCLRIVQGVLAVIRQGAQVPAYPVVAPVKPDRPLNRRGRERKYPEGAEFNCPGCRQRMNAAHPKHTRNSAPPLACRFSDVEPTVVTCPGCRNNRNYDDKSHTGDPTNCRMPGPRVFDCPGCTKGAGWDHPSHTNHPTKCRVAANKWGRRMTGGEPHRDPAIQAVGSEEDRNPLSTDMDLDADAGVAAPSGAGQPIGPLAKIFRSVPDADSAQEEIGGPAAQEEGADASAPGSFREARITAAARERAATTADSTNQSDNAAVEDWRTMDVNKALSALRSPEASVRRKAIQRLHVRWWHAPSESLKRLLEAAGAPANALADIRAVVQSCAICRDWKRPGPRNIATFRMVQEFNEEVQFDLMFYHSKMEPARNLICVAHLIDVCLRYSQTGVTSKDEVSLCTCIWMKRVA
jgi:hypothetical protein